MRLYRTGLWSSDRVISFAQVGRGWRLKLQEGLLNGTDEDLKAYMGWMNRTRGFTPGVIDPPTGSGVKTLALASEVLIAARSRLLVGCAIGWEELAVLQIPQEPPKQAEPALGCLSTIGMQKAPPQKFFRCALGYYFIST